MKRTAREKNTIIITFIFYSILLIVTTIFIKTYVIYNIDEINKNKLETKELYNKYKKIEKEGLSYNEFLSSLNGDFINNKLIKSIDKDFYNKYLKNITEKNFDIFIDKKNKELNSESNKELIRKNKEQIKNILPTYSYINNGNDNLTDFKFINYIESLSESFNLELNGAIGIGQLVLLDDYAISTNGGNSFETSIFYIPLKFNIKGTKANIIDFLYFIEHVGNIKIINNKLFIVKDNGFLSVNGIPKILFGDKYTKDYNIFEHQITDITKITFPEYLDDSYISRQKNNLLDFIKKGQGNDDFSINVDLNFYVKGEPRYEIVDFIKNVIKNNKLLYTNVNKLILSKKYKGIELNKLKKEQKILKNLNMKILSLNKELTQKKELSGIYKKAIELNKIIKPICDKFEGICEK